MYKAFLTVVRGRDGEFVPECLASESFLESRLKHENEYIRSYEIKHGTMTIGRSAPLVVESRTISRTHAEINFSARDGLLTVGVNPNVKSNPTLYVKIVNTDRKSNPATQETVTMVGEAKNDFANSTPPQSQQQALPAFNTPLSSPTKAFATPATPIVPRLQQYDPSLPGKSMSNLNLPNIAPISQFLRVHSSVQNGGGYQIRGILDQEKPSLSQQQTQLNSPPIFTTPVKVSAHQQTQAALPGTLIVQTPTISNNNQTPSLSSQEKTSQQSSNSQLLPHEFINLEKTTPWQILAKNSPPLIYRHGEHNIFIVSFMGDSIIQYRVHIVKSENLDPLATLPAYTEPSLEPTLVMADHHSHDLFSNFGLPPVPEAASTSINSQPGTNDNSLIEEPLESSQPLKEATSKQPSDPSASLEVTPPPTTPLTSVAPRVPQPAPTASASFVATPELLQTVPKSVPKLSEHQFQIPELPPRSATKRSADQISPADKKNGKKNSLSVSTDQDLSPSPRKKRKTTDKAAKEEEEHLMRCPEPSAVAPASPVASAVPKQMFSGDDDEEEDLESAIIGSDSSEDEEPEIQASPYVSEQQESKKLMSAHRRSESSGAFGIGGGNSNINNDAYVSREEHAVEERYPREASRMEVSVLNQKVFSNMMDMDQQSQRVRQEFERFNVFEIPQQQTSAEQHNLRQQYQAFPDSRAMDEDVSTFTQQQRMQQQEFQGNSVYHNNPDAYHGRNLANDSEDGGKHHGNHQNNVPMMMAPMEAPQFAISGDSLSDHSALRRSFTMTQSIDLTKLNIIQTIGSGSCGEVYKATWLGLPVAVKQIFRSLIHENAMKEFNAECNIMKRLRHPNIVLFIGVGKSSFVENQSNSPFQNSHEPSMCLVTEYMPLGSLHSVLMNPKTSIDLLAIVKMATDAAAGMNYLHQCDNPIIHRDLKSHNLLVGDGFVVKVTDFGLAKLTSSSDDNHTTFCGTLPWAAPEVLNGSGYTSKADVYSFGVVLWELLTRQEPYKGLNKPQIIVGVTGPQELRPPLFPDMDPYLSELIQFCWKQDPQMRPTFQEIVDRLAEITNHLYANSTKDGMPNPAMSCGSRWISSYGPGTLDHSQQVELAEAAIAAGITFDHPGNDNIPSTMGLNYQSNNTNGGDLNLYNDILPHHEAIRMMKTAIESGDMEVIFNAMKSVTKSLSNSSKRQKNQSSNNSSSSGSGKHNNMIGGSHQHNVNPHSDWIIDLDELTSIGRVHDEKGPNLFSGSNGSRSAPSSQDSLTLSSTTAVLPPSNNLESSDQDENAEGKCTSWHGLYRGQDVLVKVWHDALDSSDISEFHKQLSILTSIRSPRVSLFYGHIVEPRLLVVSEYSDHPTLFNFMTRAFDLPASGKAIEVQTVRTHVNFEWGLVIHLAIEVATSIMALHKWRPQIVHRDLQSSKFVVDPRTLSVKLYDIGLARFTNSSHHSTLAKVRGNFLYTAPETFAAAPFTAASDIYSFAIILWELVSRCIHGRYQIPFAEFESIRYEFQLAQQVEKSHLRPTIPFSTPEPLENLIKRCWSPDPLQRPSAELIVAELKQMEDLYKQEVLNAHQSDSS